VNEAELQDHSKYAKISIKKWYARDRFIWQSGLVRNNDWFNEAKIYPVRARKDRCQTEYCVHSEL